MVWRTTQSGWLYLGRWTLAWLALWMVSVSGCGGCNNTSVEEAKKKAEEALKEKPKPKRPFEPIELLSEPSQGKVDDFKVQFLKPGHWVASLVETKANNFDFSGELDTAATDPQSNLLELEHTPFQLTTSRPAILPKGQNRRLETTLFIPRGRERTRILTHLRDRQSGREATSPEMGVFEHMPGYQYFLLGLVSEPDRYRYLKVLDSVRPPWDDMTAGNEDFYYRVLLPVIHESDVVPVAVPRESLCWTSLAYIVWDDIDPDVLRPEQQQALVDWLYWGGQIIFSGPKTLDILQNSFLDPYLPANAAAPTSLEAEQLAELNTRWTIKSSGRPERPLAPVNPWSGIKLALRPDARFVADTGELVAERRVGRGRVVATAFRLVERDLLNWPSFDSFYNACLLGRPSRKYTTMIADIARLDWADMPERRLDPTVTSQLRYFSRDAVLPGKERSIKPVNLESEIAQLPSQFPAAQGPGAPAMDARQRDEQELALAKADSGVGGWNDFGPVANIARQTLKRAAGITIPNRDFVLQVLAIYLAVLVPLNWAVFRLLGRIEWAWVAAPLISIVCAVVVIWLAQLDIGFARSNTEVAILELQGGYPRGHVTRYTALYTSLSTTYEMNLDQPSALALPFSTDPNYELLRGQERSVVTFRRDDIAHLTNYAISSNATGMIHSEHMMEFPGAIGLEVDAEGRPQVTNATGLTLQGVGVIRRSTEGGSPVELAWIGKLEPDGAVPVTFAPLEKVMEEDSHLFDQREQTPVTSTNPPPDTLSLRELVRLAEDPAQLQPGDVRLVAWLEAELPGVQIEPAASQSRHATLVIANLRHAAKASPQPDVNLPPDLKLWFEEDDSEVYFSDLEPSPEP